MSQPMTNDIYQGYESFALYGRPDFDIPGKSRDKIKLWIIQRNF